MCHIFVCSLSRSAIFCTLSYKRHDFRRKLLSVKCVIRFSLQSLCETFLVLRITERDMIKKMSSAPPVMYLFFLSDFNKTWIALIDFRKFLKCQISWKSIQWKPKCSMRTNGRTDMTKLIVAFRNFAKASKKAADLIFIGVRPSSPFQIYPLSWYK